MAWWSIVALSSALLSRKDLQPEVSEAGAIGSPNGINRLEAVRIGGIDQWIEVRGQHANNPILLFIHGGPGVAFISMAGAFHGPLGKNLTLGEMGQPGAGENYAAHAKKNQSSPKHAHPKEQEQL